MQCSHTNVSRLIWRHYRKDWSPLCEVLRTSKLEVSNRRFIIDFLVFRFETSKEHHFEMLTDNWSDRRSLLIAFQTFWLFNLQVVSTLQAFPSRKWVYMKIPLRSPLKFWVKTSVSRPSTRASGSGQSTTLSLRLELALELACSITFHQNFH